ncbi:MAG: cytochrome c oxidase subunit II [Leucobacter sp.]
MKWVAGSVALGAALALAGCTPEQQRGYLPAGSEGATNHTEGITGLWVTSWIVLLAVGVITWGLIIWATVVYRRRKGQTGLPVQLRYNMPIETFFTIVPVVLVLGFFAFTAKEMSQIESRIDNPENVVEVIGKRWAWDFNYVDEDVFFQGVQVQTNEDGSADPNTMPVLYLPVDKTTEIRLETRDVIHSFWVVDFLYKKDMIPGQTNFMSFTPTKTGTFVGKCAELCGEYHSMMLFEVRVVEQDEYDAYIESLREAGNTGQATLELNPNQRELPIDNQNAKSQNN